MWCVTIDFKSQKGLYGVLIHYKVKFHYIIFYLSLFQVTSNLI